MDYEEAAQHVGERVLYTPVAGVAGWPGVIQAMKQMPLVKFDNGSVLQCNPFNLELDEPATLFGNAHG